MIVFSALPSVAADETPGREFTATAEVTGKHGTRRMSASLKVNRFTSMEDAKRIAGIVNLGGQQALAKALSGGGGGELHLGALVHPLSMVIAEPIDDGFRYVFVTARRIMVEERNLKSESLNYPFGILVFEVGDWGAGEGKIYPAAAIHVDPDDNSVSVDQYEIEPGRLFEIKKIK